MRTDFFSLAVVAGILTALPTSVKPQSSSLPPSDPGSALDLGILDRVIGGNPIQRYYNCVGTTFKIFHENRRYNARYYKFSISSPKSLLKVKMIETPDASLFFHLLRRDLSFIKEFRGGDDQLIEEYIEGGNYYLKLISAANMKRNPDGSNLAQITFSALPERFYEPKKPEPVSLGAIDRINHSVTAQGSLAVVQNRVFPFITEGKNQCPLAGGNTREDIYDLYVFDSAPGNIAIQFSTSNLTNWPTQYPIKAYVKQNLDWTKVEGSFRHNGGRVLVAIGHPLAASIMVPDFYGEYDMTIRWGAHLP